MSYKSISKFKVDRIINVKGTKGVNNFIFSKTRKIIDNNNTATFKTLPSKLDSVEMLDNNIILVGLNLTD